MKTSPDMQRYKELLIISLLLTVSLIFYYIIFDGFISKNSNTIGPDYGYFIPALLDGYYWYYNNGLFSIPWFTPSFCGGVPSFANPQNIYYSVPQLLTLFTDPFSSIRLTFYLFSIAGFLGFYVLLRKTFFTSSAAAFLGAILFMFNGFFAHRMIVGHMTFHSFMIIPILLYFLLRPWQISNIIISSLLLSYMVYSGAGILIPPTLLAIIVIGLIHGLFWSSDKRFWLQLFFTGILTVSLSSVKLVAIYSFLTQFPRIHVKIPGATSLFNAVTIIFSSLFFLPDSKENMNKLANLQWDLERHEFEYGITFIPLIFIVLGTIFLIIRKQVKVNWSGPSRISQYVRVSFITLLLFTPVIFNYYTPGWNAFLKQIPIIKNSTTLIRWICIYIPVVVLSAALLFDRIALQKKYMIIIAGVAASATITINMFTDRNVYHENPYGYNPTAIVSAYHDVKFNGKIPGITHVGNMKAISKSDVSSRNNAMVNGMSQLVCYEPVFGYRLQNFPRKNLYSGSLFTINDNIFNIKNPACYTYPSENRCEPGDHFRADQRRDVETFVNYSPFKFQTSLLQNIANMLSLVSLIFMIFILTAKCIIVIYHKYHSSPLV